MIKHFTVVVPARDEQDAIGDCLASLAAAREQLDRSSSGTVTCDVVVVLDRCRDQTADVVSRYRDVTKLLCEAGNVGAARRMGAATVSAAHEHWLSNTDADCLVPTDWLTQTLRYATGGADLILGTIIRTPGLPIAVREAWCAAHDQRGGHLHVHGANLGIRGNVYARLGGWAELALHARAVLGLPSSALRTPRELSSERARVALRVLAPSGTDSTAAGTDG